MEYMKTTSNRIKTATYRKTTRKHKMKAVNNRKVKNETEAVICGQLNNRQRRSIFPEL
jgi:hypothetical protein